MHASSYKNMAYFVAKYLTKFLEDELYVIDVGSKNVNGTYKKLFNNDKWHYTGIDLEAGDNVDIVLANPYDWRSIKSEFYDVVVSGQTFEHIEYFWLTMKEIDRCLKTGGLCCIIAPSEGPEHGHPHDCWRFYKDGMIALAQYVHMTILEVYTQSEFDEFTDNSDMWKDTVLICSK